CPQCQRLTVPTFQVEQARAAEHRRATALVAQLGEIANYPFRNLFAFGICYAGIVCLTIGAFTPGPIGFYLMLARESLLVGISLMVIMQVIMAKPAFEFSHVEDRASL